MNRSLEAGYGSPQCPEVVGTAQHALAELAYVPQVPFVDRKKREFVVTREEPSSGLESVMSIKGRAPRTEGEPEELAMLAAYKDAYSDQPTVRALMKVEATGMIPPEYGVELGFETESGDFFTSTGPSVEQAMAEGIAYSLVPNNKP